MSTFDDLARRYVETWNETDPARLCDAVRELFGERARYVDPLLEAEGHEQIEAAITGVHQQFPGFRFRLLGPVDSHHRQARFRWELGPDGPGDGAAPIAGFDVAVLDADGRLGEVLGFLDRVPTG